MIIKKNKITVKITANNIEKIRNDFSTFKVISNNSELYF